MNTRIGRSKQAVDLKDAKRFFYQNGGYCFDPKTETKLQGRRRCALASAIAEREAQRRMFTFVWSYDDSQSIRDITDETVEGAEFYERAHEIEFCVCRDAAGDALASLGGIIDATPNYRRVVEAELAAEAIHKQDKQFDAFADSVS